MENILNFYSPSFSPDTGDALLNLAQYNIELNKNLLPLKANVCVRSLNWMDTNLLEIADTGEYGGFS